MKKSLVLFLLAVGALFCASADAAVVTVGNHDLLANSPNQTFNVLVSGVAPGDLVPGVNFNVQIADGGAEAGGSIDAPSITGVDLVGAGLVFNGNNNGQAGSGSVVPQIWNTYTLVQTFGIDALANGILARVTVDTTGFTSGTYSVVINAEGLLGSSDFVDPQRVSDVFINGSITLVPVPEPTSLALAAIPALLGGVWLSRRRRSIG